MNLIVAATGIDTIGLLYDLSQDASTQAIADAKAFCEKNGIKVRWKEHGTTLMPFFSQLWRTWVEGKSCVWVHRFSPYQAPRRSRWRWWTG